MTVKKLLSIIIIVLLLPIALASCGGGGEPLVDANADIERCYVNAYDMSGNLISSVIIRDDEADLLYSYFATSGYATRLGDTEDSKPYITASFEKANDENGEYGGVIVFTVYSSDKVELDDEIIGKLGGAFERLASTISKKTNKVEYVSIGYLQEWDSNGKEIASAEIIGKSSRQIFYALDEGEYVKDNDRTANEMSCITVFFSPHTEFNTENGDMYEFKVYEDDYVTRKNIYAKDGYAALGHLEGAYDLLRDALIYQKEIREAERKAGFGFSSLMIQTKTGVEYDMTDFPEIGCLGVSNLIEGDGTVWWVLTIDSESEKDTRAAAEALEAREDIISVTFNYIMSID